MPGLDGRGTIPVWDVWLCAAVDCGSLLRGGVCVAAAPPRQTVPATERLPATFPYSRNAAGAETTTLLAAIA